MLETKFCDSLERVFPDTRPEGTRAGGVMLENGMHSFQLACRWEEGGALYPRVRCGLPGVTVRQVTLAPSELPCYPEPDEYYERTQPGLFPDPLLEIPACGVPVTGQSGWRCFFITADGQSSPLPPGVHDIAIDLVDPSEGVVKATAVYRLEVLPARLPPKKMDYTCWTYLDCIAQAHHVPLWSEPFWLLAEKYAALAVRYGVTMMLTPLLTPPLENAVGEYRTPVQLVDIQKEGGGWRFCFDKLDRFAAMCFSRGIRTLEIAHLFSQWGARYAPQVMARVNGREERVFGWDTPADSPAFEQFLTALLTQFKAHALAAGWFDRCVFHVSDEPGYGDRAAYAHGRALLENALGQAPIMDALSDFGLYQEGVVPIPVPATDAIEPFYTAGVKPLWGYYCCCQGKQVSNRFFSMPLSRTRIMGVQMYVYDMRGFLHWGFNHYNAQQSRVRIDPFAVTDALRAFPSGDAFSVYPAPEGPAASLRLSAFAEGLEDARLLRMAEEKLGREGVLRLLTETAGMKITMQDYPRDRAFFGRLRARVFDALCLTGGSGQ